MTRSNDEQNKFVTLNIARRLLGVGSHTMTTLLATGEMPFVEHPFNRRQKLIRLSDVRRLQPLGVPADSTIHHTVATWIIYALVDPRDDTIRYVGRTLKAKRRLQQHLQEVSINKKKEKWLRELKKGGMAPRMEVLETLECKAVDAERREAQWIEHLLSTGAPLTNIRNV